MHRDNEIIFFYWLNHCLNSLIQDLNFILKSDIIFHTSLYVIYNQTAFIIICNLHNFLKKKEQSASH